MMKAPRKLFKLIKTLKKLKWLAREWHISRRNVPRDMDLMPFTQISNFTLLYTVCCFWSECLLLPSRKIYLYSERICYYADTTSCDCTERPWVFEQPQFCCGKLASAWRCLIPATMPMDNPAEKCALLERCVIPSRCRWLMVIVLK